MLASWVRHGGDLKIITPNREVCQMDAWTGPPSLPFPSLPVRLGRMEGRSASRLTMRLTDGARRSSRINLVVLLGG